MIYWLVRWIAAPLGKIIFKTKIIGKENIPKPPAIFAMNHSDHSDSVFVSMITRKRVYFLVHYTALEPPFKTRYLVRLAKNVITKKEKGRSQETVDEVVRILKKRKYFAIFPEGTIKGKNKMLKGHTGVARIALQSKAPVVPIAIINNHGMWPDQTTIIPRMIKKVTIRIGNPLYFKEYYGQQNNRKITRKVTDRVMEEIKKLYKEE